MHSHLDRHAAHEKRIPPQLLTLLAQRLQVKHLANRRAPARQQPLVHQPAALHIRLPRLPLPDAPRRGVHPLDGRPLEARRVARHSRKLVLPDPLHRRLGGLDAEEVRGGALRDGLLLGGGEGVVGEGEAGPDEEDVSRLEGHALVRGDGFEGVEGNVGAGEAVEGLDAVFLAVERVVEEDAAADDAASLDPGCIRYCQSID
jgi:hypothetical protein